MVSIRNGAWLKILTIAMALITIAMTVTGCSCGSKEGTTATTTALPAASSAAPVTVKELIVPVNLKDARNVGSLHLEIVYNPAAISVTNVEAGDLAANAMIEYNADAAGRIKIGIVDAAGINGDGTLLNLFFKAVDNNISSELKLDNLECYDAKTLFDIIANSTPGQLSAADGSFTAPEIAFVN
ncbi:MAG: hypothetical protein JXA46_09430 [Dehalococcoidales bacterium]|nr:hypothetical protein [Dehalococcoidales bacterium]